MKDLKDITDIWIEAEEWTSSEWNINDCNTDVAVTFTDGRRWTATFFTYSNISTLIEKNRQSGECLSGKYFCASDMVLVDEVSRERIELEVVS
ncbi:MAG TPA: hypothetical protein VEF04_22645 [Blastocatellia bacterium]|nr:hypothetical protein [Blastocatellia bacterium]